MRRRKHRLVLQIRLEEEVVEVKADPPWVGRSAKVDLRRVTRAIRQASDDRRVGGLMIRLAHPEIGWSKAASLSRAIRDFRSSGKPVVAFLEGAGNLDYSLACACETLVMQPGATLDLIGLRAEAFFFKDVLDRFGIEAELESVGEYKSAAEMFVHRRMSPSYREAVEAVLTDLSQQMETAIAEGRSLSTARVKELVSQGPFLAEEARELGLVDRVEHEDICETLFQEKLGSDVVVEPQDRYPVRDGWWRRLIGFRRPQIAVVYALGVIASGDHRRSRPSPRVVGARSFGEVLKRVRDSRRVKAVVLRIESPGGAAVASDLIWRQVALTRKEKPVVVSMGDIAASGGYYIATAADAIVAEPSTLTGSIGVLGGKLVARRLLDMLGIHRETLSLSPRADFRSPIHSFDEPEREKLRAHLRFFYEKLFLPRVAEGRGLTVEQVHEVARGRVWTGRQGRERGLVDELGDLEAAIELARQKAGIPPEKKLRVVTHVRRPRLRELFSFGPPWGWEGSFRETPLAELLELFGPIVKEDVLFLMPWIFRIR